MIDDYIAVLDIGTTKIVAIVGRKDPNGNFQILGFGEQSSQGVNRGLVFNIKDTSEIIEKTVKIAKEKSGIDIKEVSVGIAGQHITSRQTSHSIVNSSEDLITQEFVDKLITEVYEASVDNGEKILHVFPQEYTINGQQTKNPVGTMSKKLSGNFHLSIVRESDLNNLKMSIEQAGLKIKNIILEPVASAEAVLSPEEKEAGVALLDIGGGTTDLIIIKDNMIKYTAVIPFGGNTVTNDIAEAFKIIKSKAEEIKIKHGSALADIVSDNENIEIPGFNGRNSKTIPIKNIANVIQSRMIEIIDTAYEEIKKSQMQDNLPAGLTITGGGSLLNGLKNLSEFRTGLEVRIGKPYNFIFSENKALSNPKYATAIGLLQKSYEYKENNSQKIFKTQNSINNNNDDDIDEQNKNENNSFKKRSNFFKNTINKLKNILIDDDIDDEEEDDD
jgi:cell division protein FtsA